MAVIINVQDEQVVVETTNVSIVSGGGEGSGEANLQEKTITKDGTYTPDEGYDGFSQVEVRVLPTDMLEGLENGWDVMFYDEHKEGLAFYCIKKGHTINPPVYDCKAWQTADGQNQDFPFTPTADIIFYANNDTYASMLYEFYGVDAGVRPYMILMCNTSGALTLCITAKIASLSNGNLKIYQYFKASCSGFDVNNVADIEAVVNYLMANAPTGSNVGSSSSYYDAFSPSQYHYTNFDITQYTDQSLGVYRLDE